MNLLTARRRQQAVGCSIVFKPAENTPLSTLVRRHMIGLASIPAEAFMLTSTSYSARRKSPSWSKKLDTPLESSTSSTVRYVVYLLRIVADPHFSLCPNHWLHHAPPFFAPSRSFVAIPTHTRPRRRDGLAAFDSPRHRQNRLYGLNCHRAGNHHRRGAEQSEEGDTGAGRQECEYQ